MISLVAFGISVVAASAAVLAWRFAFRAQVSAVQAWAVVAAFRESEVRANVAECSTGPDPWHGPGENPWYCRVEVFVETPSPDATFRTGEWILLRRP